MKLLGKIDLVEARGHLVKEELPVHPKEERKIQDKEEQKEGQKEEKEEKNEQKKEQKKEERQEEIRASSIPPEKLDKIFDDSRRKHYDDQIIPEQSSETLISIVDSEEMNSLEYLE